MTWLISDAMEFPELKDRSLAPVRPDLSERAYSPVREEGAMTAWHASSVTAIDVLRSITKGRSLRGTSALEYSTEKGEAMPVQPKIHVFFYCSRIEPGDARPGAVLRTVEELFPPQKLFATLDERTARPVPIAKPATWLTDYCLTGDIALLCNANEKHYLSLSLSVIDALISSTGESYAQCKVELPDEPRYASLASALLRLGGERIAAHWGWATPDKSSGEIAGQVRRGSSPWSSPYGLPELSSKLVRSAVPFWLGWINYWFATTVRLLGLDDPRELADFFRKVERLESGAWLAQLTEEPLDPERTEHVEALKKAYDRLPVIGGRAEPAS